MQRIGCTKYNTLNSYTAFGTFVMVNVYFNIVNHFVTSRLNLAISTREEFLNYFIINFFTELLDINKLIDHDELNYVI